MQVKQAIDELLSYMQVYPPHRLCHTMRLCYYVHTLVLPKLI